MTLTPIVSLADLRVRAQSSVAYGNLAIKAADNFGSPASSVTVALHSLEVIARETDEDDVIAEVNFCI